MLKAILEFAGDLIGAVSIFVALFGGLWIVAAFDLVTP